MGLIPRDGKGKGTQVFSRTGRRRDSKERKKVLVDDACCESSTDDEWPTVNPYKDSMDSAGNPRRKTKRR